jgi:NAD(P)-dependent dehydrogenase (short-subunit alcohol dehydrogenase family)
MTNNQSKNDLPAVLITGSSTGIGAACAMELDKLGWRVFAGVRAEGDGERLAREASERLAPVLIDVTDEQSVRAAAETIRAAVGGRGLAGLVNNAGIAVAGPLEVVPLERIRLQFEVNVIGQIAVTQAMLPMLRAAGGRIVNMGSVSGLLAVPFLGPYSASKFALEALSDALRMELHRWKISVSLVEPASVVTPIWDKALTDVDQLGEQFSARAEELYGENLRTMQEMTEKLAASGMPVRRVVRAVVHALSARRPKPRYLLGTPAQRATALVRFLPDRIRDWLMRREMGL